MKARFQIHYVTEYGQNLKVVGSPKELGGNDIAKAPYMYHEGNGLWSLEVEIKPASDSFTYKYVVLDERTGSKWSELFYEDRVAKFAKTARKINLLDQWRPLYKGAGVAIPVFSLRTENGMGVGEFLDIKKMADWANKCGFSVVQVLPIYDTSVTYTYTDSYPYSAISVFALHPQYLNIEALGKFTAKEKKEYEALKKELNELQQIDYVKMIENKWKYIRHFFAKDGRKTLASQEFVDFYHNNKEWLDDYAVFCCLRDKYKTADYSQWGKYALHNKKLVSDFIKKNPEEANIHFFVQFHLDKQLLEAKDYALLKAVKLKGDLPIGVSRHSVETWTEPELFNMNSQAGAPPDAFSASGQNWSFPTYNWEAMKVTNYTWWKKRFQKMENYFQLLRIDHILGFFRIWQIPLHSVRGLLGTFSPALPYSFDELRDRGLDFDYIRYTKPYIHHYHLNDVFGYDADFVRSTFLNDVGNTFYVMKPEYDTQRKIEAAFEDGFKDKQHLKEGLYSLLEEVLFIEDGEHNGYFHPRISLQFTRSYSDLDWYSKDIINTLYDEYFYHRHNEFWKCAALEKLCNIQQATSVLLCGEDLGMVPASVPEVMSELKLLSLLIQRMPNNPKLLFADLKNAPYLSVCGPGSHDMSVVRAWWKEDFETTKKFYWSELLCNGDTPSDCTPQIIEMVIKQHLYSPSMWAIFVLQDLLATDSTLAYQGNPVDERINEPANPKHYWRYRMHLPIENLLKAKGFNDYLKKLISDSGRK
ncbi:MAG: 4-alpha-glucanotransferase [Bacteroidales bacterium]|jgi:4-alpha-glucanotransferase|nr:4-alpha-glucanotransferase [Bacteroidales bacterium]